MKTEGKLSWLFMNKSAEGSTGKSKQRVKKFDPISLLVLSAYDKQSLLSISLNAAKAAEILTLSPAAGGTISKGVPITRFSNSSSS